MARMQGEQRRRQLLEVAADVFARNGYHGTTTAELARSAGITEPVLYQHFSSKRALFTTLVEEVGREVLDAWRAALDAAGDPSQRLRVLLGANPAVHERGRSAYRVIFHAMTSITDDDDLLQTLRDHVRTLQSFIAGELIALQQAGVVNRSLDPKLVSWMLVQMAIGFGMIAPLDVQGHQQATGAGRIQQTIAQMLQP